mgnify:CR=1 FL=1|tara:strand:+ start:2335 stop:2505 length:171 start_codon:yes stop_codon:yes gene_type:complete
MSDYESIELQIKRSIYLHIISSALESKDYEDLKGMKRMEVITVVKAFNKLGNRFAS